MTADRTLVAAVRTGLAEVAHPGRADGMQRYMRSTMPFRGVTKPARDALLRPIFTEHPPADEATWVDTVRELWHGAEFREERYAAVDLTGHRAAATWQTPRRLDLYDELIVDGAWWDYVDDLAIRRVGPILRADPMPVAATMRAWAVDADLWRRRSSVICQVAAKVDTDLDLLTDAIEANLDHRDFFVRKAIGWALRAYAWLDAEWVQAFVAAHPGMSALSRREALKNIGKTRGRAAQRQS